MSTSHEEIVRIANKIKDVVLEEMASSEGGDPLEIFGAMLFELHSYMKTAPPKDQPISFQVLDIAIRNHEIRPPALWLLKRVAPIDGLLVMAGHMNGILRMLLVTNAS